MQANPIPRTDYLANPAYIAEAVQLAPHPLIPMPDYPSDPAPFPSRR